MSSLCWKGSSIGVYIYIYSMPRVRIWIYFSFPRAQAQGSLITTVVRGRGSRRRAGRGRWEEGRKSRRKGDGECDDDGEVMARGKSRGRVFRNPQWRRSAFPAAAFRNDAAPPRRSDRTRPARRSHPRKSLCTPRDVHQPRRVVVRYTAAYTFYNRIAYMRSLSIPANTLL